MSQVSFDDFCFCSRRLSVHTFLSLSMMKTILGNWSLQLRGNSNLQNKIKLFNLFFACSSQSWLHVMPLPCKM